MCDKTCMKCPCGEVRPDPDPFDWFDDDDVKIYCRALEKVIASAMRPYEAAKYYPGDNRCPLK